MENCLFCKIVQGEIPCNRVYEDAEVLAFHDIHPAAPVHFMLIPKLHIASLTEIEDQHHDLLGKMLLLVPRLAQAQGCTDGFRTVINTGRVGGQEVYHLHIHIIGGMERLPVMIHHQR
ncbi:MAG: histidine triad nucleotide-binding protein [Nitrosomonadales bacterium]|nr:MAG: histidine triad nucleotide-binding protein [Nitrosomonadales bacterium]